MQPDNDILNANGSMYWPTLNKNHYYMHKYWCNRTFLEKQYYSPDSIPAAKVDWLHRISSIQQGTTKIRLSILLLLLLVHDLLQTELWKELQQVEKYAQTIGATEHSVFDKRLSVRYYVQIGSVLKKLKNFQFCFVSDLFRNLPFVSTDF